MQPNLIRNLLKTGKPTLSTRLHLTWPGVVEAIGHTGVFDYIEFLAEYAPFTAYDLENLCRAAELHRMAAMIKLDHQSHFEIVQAVSSGFQSVLFANARGVEDVKACVRLVRPETPEDGGGYGAVMGRFTYMDYGGGPDYVQALRDLVVAVMIEKQPAVAELEAILEVPGVDLIQWGPADFSMSAGLYADRGAPEVKATERRVIQACQQAGVAVRVEIRSLEHAQAYLDMGVRHFSLGADLRILYTWLRQNGEALRKELEAR